MSHRFLTERKLIDAHLLLQDKCHQGNGEQKMSVKHAVKPFLQNNVTVCQQSAAISLQHLKYFVAFISFTCWECVTSDRKCVTSKRTQKLSSAHSAQRCNFCISRIDCVVSLPVIAQVWLMCSAIKARINVWVTCYWSEWLNDYHKCEWMNLRGLTRKDKTNQTWQASKPVSNVFLYKTIYQP